MPEDRAMSPDQSGEKLVQVSNAPLFRQQSLVSWEPILKHTRWGVVGLGGGARPACAFREP